MASNSTETILTVTIVTPIVSVPPPVTPTVPINRGEKLKKFNGIEFKRWQQKMLFYLTTLHLARYIREEAPKQKEGEDADRQLVAAIDAWKQGDFLCRNYILYGLDNYLYNVYCIKKTAKELWESLELKYKTEDAGAKKFVVGHFLNFKMIDSKTVVGQVQEIQLIHHDIISEGMILSESFQAATIIEKLRPAWKDLKNYLKYKRKEMKLEELIMRLRIEEDNWNSEKKSEHPVMQAKANVVEHGKSSRFPTALYI